MASEMRKDDDRGSVFELRRVERDQTDADWQKGFPMTQKVIETKWSSPWVNADVASYRSREWLLVPSISMIRESLIRRLCKMAVKIEDSFDCNMLREIKPEIPRFEDMGEFPWRFQSDTGEMIMPFRNIATKLGLSSEPNPRYEDDALLQINCRLIPDAEGAHFEEKETMEWNSDCSQYRFKLTVKMFVNPKHYEFQLVRVRDIQ